MSTGQMVGRDCYYRRVDASGKVGPIQCARVYSENFLAILQREGMDAKEEKDRFTVRAASEAEYRAEHWKK